MILFISNSFFKKWEVENSKLPKVLQRPAPLKPTIFPSLDQNGQKTDIERLNQVLNIIN